MKVFEQFQFGVKAELSGDTRKLKLVKDLRTMRSLQKIDSFLKKIDFDIYFEILKLGVNITGNPNDKFSGNNRVIEFGFKKQSIRLLKTNDSFMITSFGMQFTTFFSFLHVYRFFASYTKPVTAYIKNFKLQTHPQLYVLFIKDIE